MKSLSKIVRYLLTILLIPLFAGCIQEDDLKNTPMGNFEALWKIIDEKYCFFEYKDIDWDAVYHEYKEMIHPDMDEVSLFNTLGEMLNTLRDGHVNLMNSNQTAATYYIWYDDSPVNFIYSIVELNYLKHNYRLTGGVRYQILDNNIGYMYVESFADDIATRDMNFILQFFEDCDGLIIDVRNNGGGSITNANRFASRFTAEKVLTGYIRHKTGKGHNDFSAPQSIYLTPSGNLRWTKPVAVLTNRQTYSAANEFVNIMGNLPNVVTVGDITGGGSGLPFYSELPNGWAVRFSTSPMFDSDMQHIEFGITPDHKVDMASDDERKGKDSIINAALDLFLK